MLPASPIAAATGHDAPPERRVGGCWWAFARAWQRRDERAGEGARHGSAVAARSRVVIWTMPVFPRPGAMAAAVGRLV